MYVEYDFKRPIHVMLGNAFVGLQVMFFFLWAFTARESSVSFFILGLIFLDVIWTEYRDVKELKKVLKVDECIEYKDKGEGFKVRLEDVREVEYEGIENELKMKVVYEKTSKNPKDEIGYISLKGMKQNQRERLINQFKEKGYSV